MKNRSNRGSFTIEEHIFSLNREMQKRALKKLILNNSEVFEKLAEV